MKNKNLILVTCCLSIMLLFGCVKPKYIVPNRSIDNYLDKDSINTAKSEVAPFQKPNVDNCAQAYEKEFKGGDNSVAINDGVLPAYRFIETFEKTGLKNDLAFYNYMTNQTESACFLTKDEGFVSFSHAPDSSYSQFNDLGLNGAVGGTDIFEFAIKNGKYIFTALNDKINSIFWDSHPWVGVDSICNLVLIWSSDRDNPYSITKNIEGRPLKFGNTDLFYAFKINGKWTEPHKFDTSNAINTSRYNEVSPFVACSHSAPRLLFSSNRNGDYDIYAVNINIDFVNQVISANNNAEMLPKGADSDQDKNYINTFSNEMFPMVATPYSGKKDKMLYLSSDRNSYPTKKNGSKDTIIQSKGKFDIYKFDYSLDCSPPPVPVKKIEKVVLNVNVVDALNNTNSVHSPIIKLIEKSSGKEIIRKNANEQFELEIDKDYLVYGGSEQNSSNCNEEGDSLLMYYQTKLISRLNDEIIKKTTKVDYDTTLNSELVSICDTNFVTEYYAVSSESAIKTNPETVKQNKNEKGAIVKTVTNEAIKDVNLKPCAINCDTSGLNIKGLDKLQPNEPITQLMEVKKQLITKREWYEGGKTITKSRNVITFDTIARFDTTMIPAIGAAGKSLLTHFSAISTHFIKKDTVINDIVELYPQYYVKPPCSCEFISIEHPYNKNVPYYQTAFWKVNTSEGLTEHLESFQEGNYLERASYIELSPKNRQYGAGKEARENRKKEYRKYAEIVDLSLRGMKDEITKRFIPAMEALDTIAPGNKVLIKLEAYSDIRDAGNCNYIGNSVDFIQGSVSSSKVISLSNVNIKNAASLNSDNENLSKLRVYFGFQELMKRLRWDDNFMSYMKEGLVFYPTLEFKNDEERQKALDKAKIIIIAEGKKADPQVKSDETDYDSIRRLNLHIDLIRVENGKIVISPCCNPKLPTVPINSRKK